MANLTRDDMVAELQKRGWSRFTATDLQRYLDWALQDIYGKAKFNRSSLATYTQADTLLDKIPYASIAGAEELVNEVKTVYVQQQSTAPQKVVAATEDVFIETIWPNTLDPAPDRGVPSMYFVYDREVVLYPTPYPALDVIIHYAVREDVFTSGGDTTNLPERFDKAIIALAEVHCNRRSHNYEDMSAAQAVFDEFLLNELGAAGGEMHERIDRVMPWVV